MKDTLFSIIRHALTAIPALGAGLAAKGWITAGEGAQVDALQSEALIGLAAVLAAIAARLLMVAVAKWLPGFEGLLGGNQGGKDGSGTASGGSAALLMMTLAAGGILSLLPSCVMGIDENGDWTLRPDPYSVDAALRYAIRHDDAKGYVWVDAETGEPIPDSELGDYELKP